MIRPGSDCTSRFDNLARTTRGGEKRPSAHRASPGSTRGGEKTHTDFPNCLELAAKKFPFSGFSHVPVIDSDSRLDGVVRPSAACVTPSPHKNFLTRWLHSGTVRRRTEEGFGENWAMAGRKAPPVQFCPLYLVSFRCSIGSNSTLGR